LQIGQIVVPDACPVVLCKQAGKWRAIIARAELFLSGAVRVARPLNEQRQGHVRSRRLKIALEFDSGAPVARLHGQGQAACQHLASLRQACMASR